MGPVWSGMGSYRVVCRGDVRSGAGVHGVSFFGSVLAPWVGVPGVLLAVPSSLVAVNSNVCAAGRGAGAL